MATSLYCEFQKTMVLKKPNPVEFLWGVIKFLRLEFFRLNQFCKKINFIGSEILMGFQLVDSYEFMFAPHSLR